jgi:hypothetical protein
MTLDLARRRDAQGFVRVLAVAMIGNQQDSFTGPQ